MWDKTGVRDHLLLVRFTTIRAMAGRKTLAVCATGWAFADHRSTAFFTEFGRGKKSWIELFDWIWPKGNNMLASRGTAISIKHMSPSFLMLANEATSRELKRKKKPPEDDKKEV